MSAVVNLDNFATYLANPDLDFPRALFILEKAQQLCESIVSPLPDGADVVILDVAARAYANPTPLAGSELLYSEGVGPFQPSTPGVSGGGLYLTQENRATLRRFSGGSGGAFMIDTIPATAGKSLPWWDTGVVGDVSESSIGDWDAPPT